MYAYACAFASCEHSRALSSIRPNTEAGGVATKGNQDLARRDANSSGETVAFECWLVLRSTTKAPRISRALSPQLPPAALHRPIEIRDVTLIRSFLRNCAHSPVRHSQLDRIKIFGSAGAELSQRNDLLQLTVLVSRVHRRLERRRCLWYQSTSQETSQNTSTMLWSSCCTSASLQCTSAAHRIFRQNVAVNRTTTNCLIEHCQ
jgi:hypothetical protein